MFTTATLFLVVASFVNAIPADERYALLEAAKPELTRRQLLGGGSDYAPYEMPCPEGLTWIRSADSLSSGEQQFLQDRQQYLSAINTQMTSRNLPTPPRTPVIGFALSGGGYRAMQVGLGGVMGTMNASTEAAESGIGGWLDGVTYMAGLSGGSWGTGTFMANGGQLPTDLANNLWNLQSNLILPDDGKVSFYYDLVSEVSAKRSEDFPTQITDYWALALGNHLLPTDYRLNTSPNFTFSDLPNRVTAVGNASLPMPIIIAAERETGEIVIAENATVWEFTPYEFGAWAFGADEKVRGAFTSLEYLGSELNNGSPNGTCYKGFDQLSFVMGTSSTLFNGGFLALNSSDSSSIITDAIQSVLGEIGQDKNDVSQVPNPFANWDAQPNPISSLQYVTLVDAGETNQNIPLEPLLIPQRNVDAIIAFDSSADTTYSWPNGSALYTTFIRASQLALQQNVSIRMPEVPSTAGFVNGGYNTRPTFFGCNDTTTPVIVYVPNYPWSFYGNTSTYDLAYEIPTSQSVILNGMRSFTLNGSVPTWPTCLACALSDRSFDYTRSNRTAECQSCFDKWCWAGDDNSTEPAGEYEPVVGTVPAFLSERNLTASETGARAATQTNTASGTSWGVRERKVGVVGVVGGLMAVVGGLVLVIQKEGMDGRGSGVGGVRSVMNAEGGGQLPSMDEAMGEGMRDRGKVQDHR